MAVQEMDSANQQNAERIDSLIKGRSSQEKMGLGTLEEVFEFTDKEKK